MAMLLYISLTWQLTVKDIQCHVFHPILLCGILCVSKKLIGVSPPYSNTICLQEYITDSKTIEIAIFVCTGILISVTQNELLSFWKWYLMKSRLESSALACHFNDTVRTWIQQSIFMVDLWFNWGWGVQPATHHNHHARPKIMYSSQYMLQWTNNNHNFGHLGGQENTWWRWFTPLIAKLKLIKSNMSMSQEHLTNHFLCLKVNRQNETCSIIHQNYIGTNSMMELSFIVSSFNSHTIIKTWTHDRVATKRS